MKSNRTGRIALCAEAFGFGPASKATSVARELVRRGVRTQLFGDSISDEYFRREGVPSPIALYPERIQDIPKLRELSSGVDGALVVMDPLWSNWFAGRAKLGIIDSLGFMWAESHFREYPSLASADCYFAQDIFGSADRLRSFGVRNVVAVGGIVDLASETHDLCSPSIIHLGGLINRFNPSDGFSYLDFVAPLIDLPTLQQSVVLMSQKVADDVRVPHKRTLSMSHARTMYSFVNAEVVISSPGLTTLLELAALGARVVPLPPQNFSQALIIKNVCESCVWAGDIWHFLRESYPLEVGISEIEGVALVRGRNERYRKDSFFARRFRELLSAEVARGGARATLPIRDFEGAATIGRTFSDLCGNIDSGVDSYAP